MNASTTSLASISKMMSLKHNLRTQLMAKELNLRTQFETHTDTRLVRHKRKRSIHITLQSHLPWFLPHIRGQNNWRQTRKPGIMRIRTAGIIPILQQPVPCPNNWWCIIILVIPNTRTLALPQTPQNHTLGFTVIICKNIESNKKYNTQTSMCNSDIIKQIEKTVAIPTGSSLGAEKEWVQWGFRERIAPRTTVFDFHMSISQVGPRRKYITAQAP